MKEITEASASVGLLLATVVQWFLLPSICTGPRGQITTKLASKGKLKSAYEPGSCLPRFEKHEATNYSPTPFWWNASLWQGIPTITNAAPGPIYTAGRRKAM